MASYRNSKPAASDLKQAEQMLAEARAALQEANASTDESEELLRKAHAVNTALFNLDQFLSSKGQ